MVDPVVVGTALGTAIVVVLAAAWRYGVVDKFVAHLRSSKNAHDAIPEVRQQLDRMEQKQDSHHKQLEELDRQVEVGFTTLYLIHTSDRTVNEAELRRRLNVGEVEEDLFEDDA